MCELLFWLCVFCSAYSYFFYPLILLVAPSRQLSLSPGNSSRSIRRVSIIVAARNESAKIVAKLENTLAVRHDGVELEVVVASDASDDGMDDIVRSFESRGVRLARAAERKGKEHAQGIAVAACTGEIIVFTDAGTVLPEDAVLNLLRAFEDQTLGAVSSVDKFISDDGVVHGEGLYVRYEMWLRDREAQFFSLVGLSGSFFAARREVCRDWDTHVPSDFGTALNCARFGFRAVSDRSVIGLYKNISDPSKEYQRKVRTVTRGMMGLRRRKEVLNPFRFGRFAFEVFSHKVMRWAVPWFLLGSLVFNLVLAVDSVFFRWLLLLQIGFFASPLIARTIPALMKIAPFRLCVFFVEVNVAIAHATFMMLRGTTMLTWEPSKR